jgi:hypothetical protein
MNVMRSHITTLEPGSFRAAVAGRAPLRLALAS